MVCTHLRELYTLCEQHEIRLGGTDLVRIVCKQCEEEETCPSTLMDQYESRHPDVASTNEVLDNSANDDQEG